MDFQVTKLPLLISTIMLAGCIGKENSTVPVSLRNLDKVKQKQVMNYLNEHNIKLSANSDGMNDNDIAANIPRVDAVDEPSNLYTYIDNSSDYDISLVGCDASDYMENHLESQILSNSYAPRTTNYNQKWKQYDDGNGILDPDHKTDNYIHFNNTPTGDNIVKCYYKADISETGIDHPMYFAIKHHFYTYKTFFENISDTAQAQAVHYAYQANTDFERLLPAPRAC